MMCSDLCLQATVVHCQVWEREGKEALMSERTLTASCCCFLLKAFQILHTEHLKTAKLITHLVLYLYMHYSASAPLHLPFADRNKLRRSSSSLITMVMRRRLSKGSWVETRTPSKTICNCGVDSHLSVPDAPPSTPSISPLMLLKSPFHSLECSDCNFI